MEFAQSARAQVRESSGNWMVIFADVLALLGTFFVLLFSMSAVRVDAWEQMVDSLADRLNPGRYAPFDGEVGTVPPPLLATESAVNIDYLSAVIQQNIADNALLRRSVMQVQNGRLIVSLSAGDLFEEGKSAIAGEGRQAIFHLSGLLSRVNNAVTLGAYTDELGRADEMERENWRLSLARLKTLRGVFASSGYPVDTMALLAYADSRSASSNGSLEIGLRYRLRRRIDIVIEDFQPIEGES